MCALENVTQFREPCIFTRALNHGPESVHHILQIVQHRIYGAQANFSLQNSKKQGFFYD